MRQTLLSGSALVMAIAIGLLWGPTAAATQAVAGQARAVAAHIGGTTTLLSDTGTLAAVNDAREAYQVTSAIPLLSGNVLHAVTLSWADEVDSEASLADLNLTVGGTAITADFVMADASARLTAKSSGASTLSGLSINGAPINVTGATNQKVAIPGGYLVINEQKASANRITVNALHVVVENVADVVIGSASAAIY